MIERMTSADRTVIAYSRQGGAPPAVLLGRRAYRQSSSGSSVGRRNATTIASSASVNVVEGGAFGPKPPPLLMPDEPTNHLDIESIAAVEEGLQAFDGRLWWSATTRHFWTRSISRARLV